MRQEQIDTFVDDLVHLVAFGDPIGIDVRKKAARLDKAKELFCCDSRILNRQTPIGCCPLHEFCENAELGHAGVHVRRQFRIPDRFAHHHAGKVHEARRNHQLAFGPAEFD